MLSCLPNPSSPYTPAPKFLFFLEQKAWPHTCQTCRVPLSHTLVSGVPIFFSFFCAGDEPRAAHKPDKWSIHELYSELQLPHTLGDMCHHQSKAVETWQPCRGSCHRNPNEWYPMECNQSLPCGYWSTLHIYVNLVSILLCLHICVPIFF